MILTPIPMFQVRSNPTEKALDKLHNAVQRAHRLTGHLKRVVRNHTKLETDPDVILLCSHYLANLIDATRAKLELLTFGVAPLSERIKSVLRTAWEHARSLEAEAKRLRRDQDWKTWAALSPRSASAWKDGEQSVQTVDDWANRATQALEIDDYKAAVTRLFQVTFSAASVLQDYGYDKMDTDLSRQAYLVHLLPIREPRE